MERAVGEVFDFKGIKLQVQDVVPRISCNGCYFLDGYKCRGRETDCQVGHCFFYSSHGQ